MPVEENCRGQSDARHEDDELHHISFDDGLDAAHRGIEDSHGGSDQQRRGVIHTKNRVGHRSDRRHLRRQRADEEYRAIDHSQLASQRPKLQ